MVAVPGIAGTGGSLTAAVEWIAGLLLGTAGTIVAVMAVAAVGFLMLAGRLPVRRGASAIIGCFILFSAGSVASGLLEATSGSRDPGEVLPVAEAAYMPATPPAGAYDPYAGAAVPDRGGEDLLR
ncbi:MAG TPA: TrbC/VirB2 family protein [Allosphingosinicella sp.]|nr:TrbC/VirB2 family protein [Allosphingosinicella sp.]